MLYQDEIYFKPYCETKRIIISPELGKHVIALVHKKLGHIGIKHVIDTIHPFYYFKALNLYVKNIIWNCKICIKNKTCRPRKLGFLSHFGPACAPFEIVSLDTIGVFAGNRPYKRYLHLIVDHFSHYAFISTSKHQTSSDFINFIKKIYDQHKINTLLTDQYPGINSNEFKEYLKNEQINLVFTATNCPFSNGLNERLNQTLVNRIHCKIHEGKTRAWSRVAAKCVHEYSQTNHSVTKFSPEYLLFGKSFSTIPTSFLPNQNLEFDRKTALENTIWNHECNKILIDKNFKYHEFQIGDFVYIENGSALNRWKLDEIRLGPYVILKKISSTIYEINTGHKKWQSSFFHILKLLSQGAEM